MAINKAVLLDRIAGSLLAGAAGDALGYEVEFVSYNSILACYGKPGITRYAIDPGTGDAVVSDDTQMTLFTAAGLLADAGAAKRSVESAKQAIYRAYLDWLYTQYPYGGDRRGSLVLNDPRLFALRAPGNTCLGALRSGVCGDVHAPVNRSKGCGGVMRAAPVGLIAGENADEAQVLWLGAQAAAITHGHPLGYLPAAALALIVYRLAYAQTPVTIEEATEHTCRMLEATFDDEPACAELIRQIDMARRLAKNDREDVVNIRELGEGWVGDEALVIAIYCALRHEGSIADALIAAVNHSGDSDSTGSIAGNIAGAQLGRRAMEPQFLEKLEMTDLIEAVAARLADAACPD